MKNRSFSPLPLFAALLALCLPLGARAASWNQAYGMSNLGDDPLFSGAGVPFGVITSVQSNSVYYITSAAASGAAVVNDVLTYASGAGTLAYYVGTNTWTVASNGVAGTNIAWLTGTNSGMATNDILVFRSVATDTYQMSICGSNAGSGSGLVYTNALGQCGIQFYNPLTNALTAGDKIYKMARVSPSFTLVGITSLNASTNGVEQWLRFGPGVNASGPPVKFASARVGVPSMILMTYSNTGSIFVTGEYYKRPRL